MTMRECHSDVRRACEGIACPERPRDRAVSVATAYERLRADRVGDVRVSEPMSRHTSLRIGGPADLFVVCDTVAGLADTLAVLSEEGVSFTTIGKGTNLLVADAGIRGAVLLLGKEFKRHACEDGYVRAGAACVLAYVVQDAFSRGLGGLEFAVGVPGTVGGALAMNAGARDAWIGSVTESVTLFVPGEGLVRLSGDEVAWDTARADSCSVSSWKAYFVWLRRFRAHPLEMERSLKRRNEHAAAWQPKRRKRLQEP